MCYIFFLQISLMLALKSLVLRIVTSLFLFRSPPWNARRHISLTLPQRYNLHSKKFILLHDVDSTQTFFPPYIASHFAPDFRPYGFTVLQMVFHSGFYIFLHMLVGPYPVSSFHVSHIASAYYVIAGCLGNEVRSV